MKTGIFEKTPARALRALAALALLIGLAACKWTSGEPLVTKDDADWTPLKAGSYVHGDSTYQIDGKFTGPSIVTTKTKDGGGTYSVLYKKLQDKFFLVQAVSGTEVNYLIIHATKDGFVEYRPDCTDEDRTIATNAGAALTTDETCKFDNSDALIKAANAAVDVIKSGGAGFPGDAYIRQK